ncbi:MAG: hypothetical protein Q9227_002460 [Pyrenula ochraceoflavens]
MVKVAEVFACFVSACQGIANSPPESAKHISNNIELRQADVRPDGNADHFIFLTWEWGYPVGNDLVTRVKDSLSHDCADHSDVDGPAPNTTISRIVPNEPAPDHVKIDIEAYTDLNVNPVRNFAVMIVKGLALGSIQGQSSLQAWTGHSRYEVLVTYDGMPKVALSMSTDHDASSADDPIAMAAIYRLFEAKDIHVDQTNCSSMSMMFIHS